MIGAGIFAVFALGLRHGADPDHLAAIDNLTRNSFERRPLLSRFCGTLFAGGHAVMVLSIAILVGVLGTRFGGAHGRQIETVGTWLSILVLVAIAGLNLRGLSAGAARPTGLKIRLLPRALRDATSPWLAIPVGLLFGFGFETSSQVATYAVAFGVNSGVLGALFVGLAFCLGMLCTDTLDSVLVHRLVADRSSLTPRTMRVWILSVTIVALGVAGYELAQVLGAFTPDPAIDLDISIAIVAALFAVFAYVFSQTRSGRTTAAPTPGTIT